MKIEKRGTTGSLSLVTYVRTKSGHEITKELGSMAAFIQIQKTHSKVIEA